MSLRAKRFRHLLASQWLVALMDWDSEVAWKILRDIDADDIIMLAAYIMSVQQGKAPPQDAVKRIDELVQLYRFWAYDPRGGVPIPACNECNDSVECCEKLGGEKIDAYDNIATCRIGKTTINIIDTDP